MANKGVNKVVALGHLGGDPEFTTFEGGGSVAAFSIATSETWKDKNTGEKNERTEWIRCVAYGRLGEIVRDYFRKGNKVYIEGKLRTRKWQANDGSDRWTTEVLVNEVQNLTPRDSSQAAGQQQPANNQRTGNYSHSQSGYMGDFDDDIPF